jgi:hypothetical protein
MKTVEIEWLDSYGLGPTWETKDYMEPLIPSCIRSIGFLVETTKTHTTIAQSASSEQVAGRLCIPSGCIKRIRKIS